MIATFFSALVTLALGLLRFFRKSTADKVARTDHALLEDVINRPDPSRIADDMRDGKF